VHGTTAITAITAQNTLAVRSVTPLTGEVVLEQVRAVLADIRVDAVKVGMLGTVEVTRAVARAIDELTPGTPVVVDPVMVAESGARLLAEDAERALIDEILPRASVLTPNLPEARVLAGAHLARGEADGGDLDDAGAAEQAEAEALARAVLALGPRIVVLTGGHRARASDLFLDAADERALVAIDGPRHADGAAHGSGCTHSSVLAAQLALGRTPLEAARLARQLAGEAVAHGLRDVGAGAGPVDVLDLSLMRSR
jgi:hydroxymethylpyrimidine/phosphomethylpyrimidine kinase